MNEETITTVLPPPMDNGRAGVPAMTFSHEQIELVKRTIAKNTTDDELALFLYTCKRTGLDPLAKQIHCIRRVGKSGPQISIQTSIDGYRLIADRTGKYAGNDDPIFDDEATPRKATVTVYKLVDGQRCPFSATARWDQYFPGEEQGFMWKKMPHLMLGKCAEALALRKAFPAELSGLYTDDEMAQAGRAEPAQIASPQAKAPAASPSERPKADPAAQKAMDGAADSGWETFVPTEVNKKSGKGSKGDWSKYGIKSPAGVWYGTFDSEFGELAVRAKSEKFQIRLKFQVNDKGYNDVTELEQAVQ